MATPDENRYRSRTYWLVWGCVILGTALTYSEKLEGTGWTTLVLGLVAAWQLRRGWDNKLAADGGGK
jgi:hypothetical protein